VSNKVTDVACTNVCDNLLNILEEKRGKKKKERKKNTHTHKRKQTGHKQTVEQQKILYTG
jgi:ribosomal protein L21